MKANKVYILCVNNGLAFNLFRWRTTLSKVLKRLMNRRANVCDIEVRFVRAAVLDTAPALWPRRMKRAVKWFEKHAKQTDSALLIGAGCGAWNLASYLSDNVNSLEYGWIGYISVDANIGPLVQNRNGHMLDLPRGLDYVFNYYTADEKLGGAGVLPSYYEKNRSAQLDTTSHWQAVKSEVVSTGISLALWNAERMRDGM